MQIPPGFGRIALLAMGLVLWTATSANAAFFANGSFENAFASWNVIGDTNTFADITFQTTSTDGTTHAVLSTAPGSANQVGGGAVPAASVISALGISAADFASVTPAGFTAFEGAGIEQTFDTLAGGNVTFDWNFLSDEADAVTQFGDAFPDFAIVHVSDVNDPLAYTQIFLLADADVFETTPAVPVIAGFDAETGWNTFDLAAVGAALPGAGTYSLGIAVFDVNDNLFDSALAVDNIQVPEPATLMLLGMGLIGLLWVGRERPQGDIDPR